MAFLQDRHNSSALLSWDLLVQAARTLVHTCTRVLLVARTEPCDSHVADGVEQDRVCARGDTDERAGAGA